MNEEKLLELIKTKVEEKDGKKYLACKSAFEISVKLEIPTHIIGKVCNQNKIKIKSCQMGCF
jgi:hypothetical protein